MSLTPGKGWASGEFGALKNVLVVVNLVGMLKITWGAAKSQCPGCTPTRLLYSLWVGAQATTVKAASGPPKCRSDQFPARVGMGGGGSDRRAGTPLGSRGGTTGRAGSFCPCGLLQAAVLDAWPYLVPFLQVMKLRLRKAQGLEEGEGEMYGKSNMETYIQFGQSCPTLCNPMDCSTPGFPVNHQLPEPTQTHVHRVGDAIQPSHPLLSPSPAFNLFQHQGLFQ